MRPGDRLTAFPVPLWFKWSAAIAIGFLTLIWADYLVNWRWIVAWLTGSVR